MLLLDVGNSRVKWAFVRDGKWLHSGAVDNSELVTLKTVFAQLPIPSRIVVSNVAGEEMQQRVYSLFAQWNSAITLVMACEQQCGVTNGYQMPSQLGSDRWAALIAAWHDVQGACIVVNCGTATTVDAVSQQGKFLGGIILPGMQLMHRSLVTHTAQLNTLPGELSNFPVNTADAIHTGIVRATLGAVEKQFELLASSDAKVQCVLGGGSAEQLAPHLNLPFQYIDNLVLRGLQIIGEERV